MEENRQVYSDNDDLGEFDEEPFEIEAINERSVSSDSRASRGRPRIIESWSRVISLADDDLENIRIFPIATDLQLAPNLPTGSTPVK